MNYKIIQLTTHIELDDDFGEFINLTTFSVFSSVTLNNLMSLFIHFVTIPNIF